MKVSQSAQAEQILSAIPRSDRDFSTAQTLLGFLLLQRSALPQAESAFRTALDAQEDDSKARLGLGMVLLKRGAAARALTEFEGILAETAIGLKAQAYRIQSLLLTGRTEDAFRESRRLIAEYPGVADFHNLLGFLYQTRSQAREASQEYLESVRLDPDSLPTYLDLVSVFRSLEEWDSALRWAERALELDSSHPLLYQSLAAIYEKLGRTEEAISARNQAEQTFDAEVCYARAVKSARAGHDREAEGLLRASTDKNPRLAKAWIELGELLRREKRLQEACQAFLRAVEVSPGETRAVVGVVDTLRAEGKEAQALRYAQDAVARGAASPDLLASLGVLYRDQGMGEEAETVMMQAIRQLPDHPDLLSFLGYLQQSNGKNDQALESYSAALRLDPGHVDALIGQARSILLKGNPQEALVPLRLANSLDGKNTRVLKVRIEAYRLAGDPKSAEASCRACLAIDRADLECREQLAALRMQASDYREAAGHYQMVVRNGAAAKGVVDALAFSLMKLGETDRAIELFRSSLQRFGPDGRVYTYMGYLHRCRGDLKAAISNYRLARDMAASDPDRNFDLGLAQYLARDYAGAVLSFQEANRLRADWGLVHYYLSLAYWNLGQNVLALAHARRAQSAGVPAAGAVVRSLQANLSIGAPGYAILRPVRR